MNNIWISIISVTTKDVKKCVNKARIGFMMEENYHAAMRIVRHVRKTLKVNTVFNILGPLLNPARASFAVIGVHDETIVSSFQISYYRTMLITKSCQYRARKIHIDTYDLPFFNFNWGNYAYIFQ